MTSPPRERERELRGMETREAAEGNEVIWNKSNCFGKKNQNPPSLLFFLWGDERRQPRREE